MDNQKIDIVIAWVDGSDEKWLKEKEKYSDFKTDIKNTEIRYRDFGILKYWFRGIEKFAPWVNKIHFVTYGHIPEWLNTENRKLNIVFHKDYIPSKYLPTFSSRPIELNFHRIKGLSNKFIYFNDDMFITNYVKPDDFFKKGYPRYCAILDSLRANNNNLGYAHILLNVSAIINNNFNKRNVMIKNLEKWFSLKYGKYNLKNILNFPYKDCSRLCNFHSPYPYMKGIFEEVWENEESKMDETCMNKFRTLNDVNQTIFWNWAIFKGEFYPQNANICKYTTLTSDNSLIIDYIVKQKYKILCINDTNKAKDVDFEKIKKELANAFDFILNEKSSFEK